MLPVWVRSAGSAPRSRGPRTPHSSLAPQSAVWTPRDTHGDTTMDTTAAPTCPTPDLSSLPEIRNMSQVRTSEVLPCTQLNYSCIQDLLGLGSEIGDGNLRSDILKLQKISRSVLEESARCYA